MGDIKPTPAQADMGKPRVLCVYGSETGNSKRGIERHVKKWCKQEGLSFAVKEVISGNELNKRLRSGDGQAQAASLEYLAQQCDVLLVATSSHGAGDPPSNYGEFVKLLCHEASMKSDALKGMQHAVLGFGSSTYTTFQNIPRLTDKFLGECGSRRLARRAEIDEHDPNPGEEADWKRWGEDVFAALQALPAASAAAACEWSKPADNVDASGLMEDDEVATSAGRFHPMYLACYAAIGAMFAARYALAQK